MRSLSFLKALAGAGAVALFSIVSAPAARAQSNPLPTYCGYNGYPGGNFVVSPGYGYNCPTQDDVETSLGHIADDRISHIVTNRRLASILLGATEQINCGDCFSAFGALGSFSAGAHGRKNLGERLSVLGGVSYNQYDSGSVRSRSAPILALGLRYDLADWGGSRPFFEIGGSLAPQERTRTVRVVNNGGQPGFGVVSANARTWSVYGRAGWVKRLSPVAEFAAYVDLGHSSQRFSRASEAASDVNPVPVIYGAASSSLSVVKVVAQHTQLLSSFLEAHLSAGLAHGFGAKSGLEVVVPEFNDLALRPAARNSTWAEFDGRLGFRIKKGLVIDVFALTTVGAKPVGSTIHGGLGLRYTF